MREDKASVCIKCGNILTLNDHVMEIITEDETIYYFCVICIRQGYLELDKKLDRTWGETQLMGGLLEFLKNHKQIAIS